MQTPGFQGSAVIFDTYTWFKSLAEGVAGRNFEHYYMYLYVILGLTKIYRKNPDAFSSLIRDVEVLLVENI